MESSKIKELESQITQLNDELQHQKGMLWVIGEIIKNSTHINAFHELMKLITDMLMGVMGVSACYIWIYSGAQYTLHYRSVYSKNRYHEILVDCIPAFLYDIETQKPFLDTSIRTPLISETPLPNSRLAVPLFDYQGNTSIGFLVVEHNLTNFFTETTTLLFETLAIIIGSHSQKSKLFELAAQEAEHDPLTKTYNRKFLSQFLDGFESTSSPLSLCIFDVDCFKYINDSYGHSIGDDVLIAIAQAAYHILQPYKGKLIRYGGDEFVVLLELPLQKAIPVLEKIRTAIHTLPITKKIRSNISITMGVSQYPCHTKNVHKLLHLADAALLQGKSLGKDTVKIG